jgi:hypothetical protein
MLPILPQPILQHALTGLEALCRGKSNATIRVGTADGSTVEGSLIGASPGHVTVGISGSPIVRRIPADEIHSLALEEPHRGREWALAGAGIIGATAAMVGLVSVPGIGAYLRTHALSMFRIVFFLGVGLLTLLLARTRLHAWLSYWRILYQVDDA